MKFAHISDTHLGNRQFGLTEREKDFYEVFEKIIDKIIDEKVDFVIHSGDIFETNRPTPLSILKFQKAVLKLKGSGIPMYVIAGNHDSVLRDESIPPNVIFKINGVKVISPINTDYVYKDVFIGGLPFYPNSQIDDFKNKLKSISEKAKKYEKSILVLHQGIDKYLPFQYELEIGDLPDNFNYYAFGHIHNYIKEEFGKGYLVYPGSTEIWKSNEVIDYKKNGKGFVIVDLDGDKPIIDRIVIDSPRKFINKVFSIEELEKGLLEIKEDIKDLKYKPIVNIEVKNVNIDTNEIYELINKIIGEYSLRIRTKFSTEDIDEDNQINMDKSLGTKDLILEKLKDYESEDINNLAIELFENLSSDKNDDALLLVKTHFDKFYDFEEVE